MTHSQVLWTLYKTGFDYSDAWGLFVSEELLHFTATSLKVLCSTMLQQLAFLAEFNGHQVCQGKGFSTLMKPNPAGCRLLASLLNQMMSTKSCASVACHMHTMAV